ncbi:MAG TPA: ABC transporter ATP-binding protein [Haliangiales bacterium]|nr:ABC transporter ATP-binding protein [Haliangiales bacterium]
MIEARELRKRFGRTTALDGVSFSVARGEVAGFLGPNGAGKTTLLRLCAGYLLPDAGHARVDGIDVADRPLDAQARLGYLPEGAPLPGDLRVADYLRHRARLKRADPDSVGPMLERTGAADVARRLVSGLSRGYRQRVGLADALLGDPPALLLDEPTAGLDPNQIRDTLALIGEIGRDRAVLFASHILSEVETVATRVLILVGGKLRAEGSLDALRRGGATRLRVAPGEETRAREALGEGAEIVDGALRVPLPPEEAARRVVGAGCALVELGRDDRSLAELFAELTS